MKLKLYVWENVLHDYTAGMMCALAKSPAQAREVLLLKCDYIPKGDLDQDPQVIENPEGFVVWGGS